MLWGKDSAWQVPRQPGVRCRLLGATGGCAHAGPVAARSLFPAQHLQGNKWLQWIPPPTDLQITGKWITKFCHSLFKMCSQAPSANSYRFVYTCDFPFGLILYLKDLASICFLSHSYSELRLSLIQILFLKGVFIVSEALTTYSHLLIVFQSKNRKILYSSLDGLHNSYLFSHKISLL